MLLLLRYRNFRGTTESSHSKKDPTFGNSYCVPSYILFFPTTGCSQ